ncbi:MAG: NAD+ synthase, partial [Firmicutes bacterium]|nr:NAD+ synthase [Bacillota bacterium]
MLYSFIDVPGLELDQEYVHETLVEFVKDQMSKARLKKAVFGLSGGLDSAVLAFLLVDALGSDNVLAAILPYNTTGPEVLKDAETVRDLLGLPSVTIDITEVVDNCYRALFAATGEEPDKVRLGNIMARQRMILLYDLSAAISGLVIGTSNKTELLLGYGTLHGDLAFAFDPLGDLYKTQIRAYARYLGVPENIVTKPPSADFWVGQTDEEDLGFTYDDLDKLLYLMIEERRTKQELLKIGFDRDFLDAVRARIRSNKFKTKMPALPRLQRRGIGGDYR